MEKEKMMLETTKPKRPRGRPRKPGGPRGKVTLAFSEGEWSAITTAATAAGLTAAEYVRRWAVGGQELQADLSRLLATIEPAARPDCLQAALCRCVRRSLSRITGP